MIGAITLVIDSITSSGQASPTAARRDGTVVALDIRDDLLPLDPSFDIGPASRASPLHRASRRHERTRLLSLRRFERQRGWRRRRLQGRRDARLSRPERM
jgi:hypothetical protein